MGKRGRFFSNKRGMAEEVLLEIMQALAILLVITGNMMYVNSRFSKIGFAKPFYARDIGLMITAAHSAEGNLYYTYNIPPIDEKNVEKYKFQFQISDNFVLVNATDSPKQNLYWYFSDLNILPINYDQSGIRGLFTFSKEGNRIDIGKSLDTEPNTLTCPFVNTYNEGWLSKSVIIDSAHGESSDDKGGINKQDNSYYESALTKTIATRIELQNKILTRPEDNFVKISQRREIVQNNGDAAVLVISTGDYPETGKNYIKAYYNINSDEATKAKSRKLGCKILNRILIHEALEGRNRINGVIVVPSDSDYITQIIPAGRVGVILELGNIQIPKLPVENNFLSDTTDLANAIKQGIGDYYAK
ncbi:N-acetylmuramoyl-L-alanine amidase [Candidatus Woesearchaeota archaeon]|nr:N-acetylmuramoyl-L-alanine amidase [Candidatus Woesearchaeota archaeon]